MARAVSPRPRRQHRLPLHPVSRQGPRQAAARNAVAAATARHPACLRRGHRRDARSSRVGRQAARVRRRQAWHARLGTHADRRTLRRHHSRSLHHRAQGQLLAPASRASIRRCQAAGSLPVPPSGDAAALLPGHPDPYRRQPGGHRRSHARLPSAAAPARRPRTARLVQGARIAHPAPDLRQHTGLRAAGTRQGPPGLERAAGASCAGRAAQSAVRLQGPRHGQRPVDHHGPSPARTVLQAPRPAAIRARAHSSKRAGLLLSLQRRPVAHQGRRQPRERRHDRPLRTDSLGARPQSLAHRGSSGRLPAARRDAVASKPADGIVQAVIPARAGGHDVRLRLQGSALRHRARIEERRALHALHGLLHLPQRDHPLRPCHHCPTAPGTRSLARGRCGAAPGAVGGRLRSAAAHSRGRHPPSLRCERHCGR